MTQIGFRKSFLEGLFYKNPFFVLFLGLTLVRVSTSRMQSALIIGRIAFIELRITQVYLSLLRKHLDKVGAYITALILASGLSTRAGRVFGIGLPELTNALNVNGSRGTFLRVAIPFLCTSSFVLDQADEALFHDRKDTLGYSLGSGLGFLLALLLISFFRELLATGGIVFCGFDGIRHSFQFFESYGYFSLFDKPFGGLLLSGLLRGFYRTVLDLVLKKKDKKAEEKEAE